ncbi:hypothetical protein D3C85_1948340 [compost metagenome]
MDSRRINWSEMFFSALTSVWLYLATAMSYPAEASPSSERNRPPSKIGNEIAGPTL